MREALVVARDAAALQSARSLGSWPKQVIVIMMAKLIMTRARGSERAVGVRARARELVGAKESEKGQ